MAETPSPIDHVQDQLRGAGYLADTATGTVVHLAAALGKPILIEGPAGTGKTRKVVSGYREKSSRNSSLSLKRK